MQKYLKVDQAKHLEKGWHLTELHQTQIPSFYSFKIRKNAKVFDK